MMVFSVIASIFEMNSSWILTTFEEAGLFLVGYFSAVSSCCILYF
jgi:hypothetical protein